MKLMFVIILGFLFSGSVFGQATPNCNCPKTQYASSQPDTIFHLSNGKSIALCGYRNNEKLNGHMLYSEFILSTCSSNKVIGFWGAVETCLLKVIKDTLIIEQLKHLPSGKQMKYQETPWIIEHIYFVKNNLQHNLDVAHSFPKYNERQIDIVLKLFQSATGKLDDKAMEIADKLFISAISGSSKARDYLINFTKYKSQLDGEYGEEYHDLIKMLKLWDQNRGDDNLKRKNIPYLKN